MPVQKIGIECPSSVTTRTMWSVGLFLRTAAQTPSGMPRPAPSRMAKVASSIVAGITAAMSSATGWPVRSDVPKSPRSDVAEVAGELHVDRLVHPELLVDLLVGRRVGLLADDRPHRVDRHQPPDGEGEDEEPEQRDEDRPGLPGEGRRPRGGQSHRIISRSRWRARRRGARPRSVSAPW